MEERDEQREETEGGRDGTRDKGRQQEVEVAIVGRQGFTFFCAAKMQFIVDLYCTGLSCGELMMRILEESFFPTGVSLLQRWMSVHLQLRNCDLIHFLHIPK